ncbi:MAG: flagellar basal-body MS-ring/collar protein FliF [Planctomycetaceae bacterium]|nr:flagellar M-ring protein FliF [Planctomycetaceae bacterium]
MGQLENMGGLLRRLTLVQRVVLLTVVLAVVVACVMLVGWAQQPQMALLYGSLAPEEAAKVVDKVREEGSPFELGQGGTAVYVPVDKVAALRLATASAGLPAADRAGYRILDDEKIGTSPFAQRVNHVRAIEGELAKSLQMIEGVLGARVHVVKPESSVFAGKGKDPSATVVLRLRSGWKLSPANVSAVTHMVAGSIEGMTAAKVMVVDSAGNLLSGEGGDEFTRKADTFLDYKSRVEGYLAKKAEDMLTAVLGPNRVSVRVTAEIDTLNGTQTIETFDPAKRVVSKEEIRSSSGATAGKEENITNEYLVSRTVEQRQDLPGRIKSLSVAAFVCLAQAPPAGEADKGAAGDKKADKPAAGMNEKDVEEIIRNAIGLKESDTLKVVNTAFYEHPAETAGQEQGMFTLDFMLELGRRLSLGILVVGVLVALKMMRGPRKNIASQAALADLPSQQALPGGAAGNLLPSDAADPNALRMQITHALQEKPEEVKRLFLNWAQTQEGAG